MTTTPNKPWYASKTIWVNALALVVVLVQPLGLTLSIEEQTAVLAVVNIVLRWVTVGGVA